MATTFLSTVPQDIQPEWLNLVRRLQSASQMNHGFAVVSIHVLINADGKPIGWVSPKVVTIEPKRSNADMDTLLRTIFGDSP